MSMKAKLILSHFGGIFGTLMFSERSSFTTLLRFTPYWLYTPTYANHANSPGVYTSDIILNLRKKDETHLNCDVIDGSVVNRIRQPILFSFVLDKPGGCKIYCEPQAIHYKKNKNNLF